MNPILVRQEQIEQERKRSESFRFPIRIHYVYPFHDRPDPNNRDVAMIRDFCRRNNIHFLARAYDMEKYKEDCDSIERLPAYQIYYKYDWDSVCYYPLSAVSIVKKLIVEHEEKQRRIQDWGKKRNRVVEFFRNLFRRQPLMERSRRSF